MSHAIRLRFVTAQIIGTGALAEIADDLRGQYGARCTYRVDDRRGTEIELHFSIVGNTWQTVLADLTESARFWGEQLTIRLQPHGDPPIHLAVEEASSVVRENLPDGGRYGYPLLSITA